MMHMGLSYGHKTLWIMISWLLMKPADHDLPCSQKRVFSFEKVTCTVCLLDSIQKSMFIQLPDIPSIIFQYKTKNYIEYSHITI